MSQNGDTAFIKPEVDEMSVDTTPVSQLKISLKSFTDYTSVIKMRRECN